MLSWRIIRSTTTTGWTTWSCRAASTFSHQDRINTWNGFAELGVQFYNFLVLGTPNVCSIGITACASNITELTTKSIATPCGWATCPCFYTGLLLFVFLPFQVFFVCLRPCTRYLADLTVVQLLWFWGYSWAFEDPSTLLHPWRPCRFYCSPLTNLWRPCCWHNVDCGSRLGLDIDVWFCSSSDSRGKLTRLWVREDGGRVGCGRHCCVLVRVRGGRGVRCTAAVSRGVCRCWYI